MYGPRKSRSAFNGKKFTGNENSEMANRCTTTKRVPLPDAQLATFAPVMLEDGFSFIAGMTGFGALTRPIRVHGRQEGFAHCTVSVATLLVILPEPAVTSVVEVDVTDPPTANP
jgi:hypothetical protein